MSEGATLGARTPCPSKGLHILPEAVPSAVKRRIRALPGLEDLRLIVDDHRHAIGFSYQVCCPVNGCVVETVPGFASEADFVLNTGLMGSQLNDPISFPHRVGYLT